MMRDVIGHRFGVGSFGGFHRGHSAPVSVGHLMESVGSMCMYVGIELALELSSVYMLCRCFLGYHKGHLYFTTIQHPRPGTGP